MVRSRLLANPVFAQILGNVGWLFADRIFRLLIGLIVGLWLARYLGPESFGALSYSIAFLGIFGAIASLGLDEIVVRDLVRAPDDACRTLGSAAVAYVFGSIICLFAAVGSAMLLDEGLITDDVILVAVVSTALLFYPMKLVRLWFDAIVQSRYAVWAENGALMIAASVRVGLILANAPLLAFAWVVALEAALMAIGIMIVYRRTGYRIAEWRIDIRRMERQLADSWPMMLAALSVMLYMRVDQVMLGEMTGRTSVGIYSAAVKITELVYVLPVAVATSVFPSILRARSGSPEVYASRLQLLYDAMVIASLAVAFPVFLFSDEIVRLLFGSAYEPAAAILAIYVWASVFVYLGVVSGKALMAEGLQIVSFQRTVAGAMLNIVMNYFLIPDYGGIGAAWATVLSFAVAGLGFDFVRADTRNMARMKLRALDPLRLVRRVLEWARKIRPSELLP